MRKSPLMLALTLAIIAITIAASWSTARWRADQAHNCYAVHSSLRCFLWPHP